MALGRVQCHSQTVVKLGALGVFIAGCIVTTYAALIIDLSGYEALHDMVAADTTLSTEDPRPFSLRLFTYGCLAFGVITAVAGIIGCIGAHLRSQGLICTYFTLTSLIGMFFCGQLLVALIFEGMPQPVLTRQGQEFCNAEMHWTFESALGCAGGGVLRSSRAAALRGLLPFSGKLPHQLPSVSSSVMRHADLVMQKCGEECQSRLRLLRRMGGCKLLQQLCNNFVYTSVGKGFCVVNAVDGSSVLPPTVSRQENVTAAACHEACDDLLPCVGFVHDEAAKACHLVSVFAPKHAFVGPGWEDSEEWTFQDAAVPVSVPLHIAAADGRKGLVCQRKGSPLAIEQSARSARLVALCSLLATAVLSAATVCGCCLQYTLVTRRKGRKGASALIEKMMCSCCRRRRTKKYRSGVSLEPAEGQAHAAPVAGVASPAGAGGLHLPQRVDRDLDSDEEFLRLHAALRLSGPEASGGESSGSEEVNSSDEEEGQSFFRQLGCRVMGLSASGR